jgi:hypothetical protein
VCVTRVRRSLAFSLQVPSAAERGTWPRSLRSAILARSPPPCAHDDTSSSFSNGAASQTPAATKWCNCHSCQVQAAPPSAEHSCDRQARSDRPRKADTFAASPCALTAPNGFSHRASSISQSGSMGRPSKSRLPMSHRKTDLGIPRRSKSAKVVPVGAYVCYKTNLRSRTIPPNEGSVSHCPALSYRHYIETVWCGERVRASPAPL